MTALGGPDRAAEYSQQMQQGYGPDPLEQTYDPTRPQMTDGDRTSYDSLKARFEAAYPTE